MIEFKLWKLMVEETYVEVFYCGILFFKSATLSFGRGFILII